MILCQQYRRFREKRDEYIRKNNNKRIFAISGKNSPFRIETGMFRVVVADTIHYPLGNAMRATSRMVDGMEPDLQADERLHGVAGRSSTLHKVNP